MLKVSIHIHGIYIYLAMLQCIAPAIILARAYTFSLVVHVIACKSGFIVLYVCT